MQEEKTERRIEPHPWHSKLHQRLHSTWRRHGAWRNFTSGRTSVLPVRPEEPTEVGQVRLLLTRQFGTCSLHLFFQTYSIF